jgi:hypothetical protein
MHMEITKPPRGRNRDHRHPTNLATKLQRHYTRKSYSAATIHGRLADSKKVAGIPDGDRHPHPGWGSTSRYWHQCRSHRHRLAKMTSAVNARQFHQAKPSGEGRWQQSTRSPTPSVERPRHARTRPRPTTRSIITSTHPSVLCRTTLRTTNCNSCFKYDSKTLTNP